MISEYFDGLLGGNWITNARIDEALDERVGSTRLFGEATSNYSQIANEISAVQMDLVNNRLQKRTVAELQKLRQDLVNKFSIAKTQMEHSKLLYENLVHDTTDLESFLSNESISKRKEELMRSFLTKKKKIEELTRKKFDIIEINKIIDKFNGIQELNYTEEELNRIFGDQVETIKDAPGIMKRVQVVKEKKEAIKDAKEEKDEEKEDTPDNSNEVAKVEDEFENREVVRYIFKANIGHSVEKLKEAQQQLQQSIAQYEREILDIKKSYLEDVKKFEAIKKIVGYENEEEEEEGEDVEMAEANEKEQEHEPEDVDLELVEDEGHVHAEDGPEAEEESERDEDDLYR